MSDSTPETHDRMASTINDMRFATQTDTGAVRRTNQDFIGAWASNDLACAADGLFVLADGMGGQAGGEVASKLAVETVESAIDEALSAPGAAMDEHSIVDAMRDAIARANQAVWRAARRSPELRGMGTTCVAVLVSGSAAVVSNVGDSRAYVLRSGKLTQITQDHSLVQEYVRAGELTKSEAQSSKFRNVLTRAVGISSTVDPDVEVIALNRGDRMLLCSDGLTGVVSDAEIADVLTAMPDPHEACDRLVARALSAGGPDNVSVIVVDFGPLAQPPTTQDTAQESIHHTKPQASQHSRSSALTILTLVTSSLAVIAVALGLIATFRGKRAVVLPQQAPQAVSTTAEPPGTGVLPTVYGAPVLLMPTPVRGAPLACDPAGNVFVTTPAGRILRVSPDGRQVRQLAMPPAPAIPPSRARWATDQEGNLYVSSFEDRAIYKYSAEGTRIQVIGEGELKGPESIAVDGKLNLYVVDRGRLRVIRVRQPGTVGSGN